MAGETSVMYDSMRHWLDMIDREIGDIIYNTSNPTQYYNYLKSAREEERSGASRYMEYAVEFNSLGAPNIAESFREMSADERKHAALLSDLITSFETRLNL